VVRLAPGRVDHPSLGPAGGTGRSAVFLDRDGVLIEPVVRDRRPYPPTHARQLVLVPGALAACYTLRQAGFALVVVTNQPDVARGTLDPADLEAMHGALRCLVELDDIRVCPHDDADDCRGRKPRPGMLVDAARDHGLDLASSFMVGDRWRDVEAGQRAGCRTVHVDHDWDERRPQGADATVTDLAEASRWILQFAPQEEIA
jgi:D-glycero-D-manno-heptose 1,7-bisphosphate phosphatase